MSTMLILKSIFVVTISKKVTFTYPHRPYLPWYLLPTNLDVLLNLLVKEISLYRYALSLANTKFINLVILDFLGPQLFRFRPHQRPRHLRTSWAIQRNLSAIAAKRIVAWRSDYSISLLVEGWWWRLLQTADSKTLLLRATRNLIWSRNKWSRMLISSEMRLVVSQHPLIW